MTTGRRPSLPQAAARQDERELARLWPAGRLRTHARRPRASPAESAGGAPQVSLVLPSLQDSLGPGATYLLFAGVGVVAVGTIYAIVPVRGQCRVPLYHKTPAGRY